MADAGLTVDDIDGLAMYPGGGVANLPGCANGNLYEIQDALGITTTWRQGIVEGMSLPFYGPAQAVATGQARHAVIWRTVKEGSAARNAGGRPAYGSAKPRAEFMNTMRSEAGLLGTPGTGWDVGWAATFLASDEARWITGVTLPVESGAPSVTPLMMAPYLRGVPDPGEWPGVPLVFGSARSVQHEHAVVVGVGLRLCRHLPPDAAVRRLAGLADGDRRHDRGREHDRRAHETRQRHKYAVQELHAGHLRPPAMIVFTPLTEPIMRGFSKRCQLNYRR